MKNKRKWCSALTALMLSLTIWPTEPISASNDRSDAVSGKQPDVLSGKPSDAVSGDTVVNGNGNGNGNGYGHSNGNGNKPSKTDNTTTSIDPTGTTLEGSAGGTEPAAGTEPTRYATVSGVRTTPDQITDQGTINFTLSEPGLIQVEIYDGSTKIRTLMNRQQLPAGTNQATWDGTNEAGILQTDRNYTVKILVLSAEGVIRNEASGTIMLNKSQPVISDVTLSHNLYKPGREPLYFNYGLSEDTDTAITIKNSAGETVMTLAGTSSQGEWSGRDNSGVIVPTGEYTYIIEATDAVGAQAEPVSGQFLVNSTLLSDVSVAYQSDLAAINYKVTEPVLVTTKIYNSNDELVRTLSDNVSQATGMYTAGWDFRETNGSVVTAGTYTYTITVLTEQGRTAEATGSVQFDKQAPVISEIAVTPGFVNTAQGTSAKLAYRVSDAGTTSVFVEGAGKTLLMNQQVTAGQLVEVEWDGKDDSGQLLASGTYSFTIFTTDTTNETSTATMPVFVNYREGAFLNFSDGPDLLKVTDASTSMINFDFVYGGNLTLELFDSQGNKVRTLLTNAAYGPSSNVSVEWDGKNDAGVFVADGTYTYKVSGTDLSGVPLPTMVGGTITTDQTTPTIGSVTATPNVYSPKHDPNVTIAYELSEDSTVTIGIYDSADTLIKTIVTDEAHKAGMNSMTWDGKNNAGVVVPDGTYSYKIIATDQVGFASNVWGGIKVVTSAAPVISGVNDGTDPLKVTGTTASTIYYTLSAPANVTLRIYDEQGNLVRTLLENVPTTAGAKPVAWNGKNDAGNLVEDGTYTYKFSAVNTVGRVAKEVTGTITTDKTAPTVTGLVATPYPFAPQGDNKVSIRYELNEDAKVTLGIYNTANVLVKTITTAAPTGAGTIIVEWDGKDNAGNIVPAGAYAYKILATDKVGFSRSVQGVLRVEKPIFISNVSDTHDLLKTTGTNAATIYYTLSEQANVTLKIYNSQNQLVRTLINNVTTPEGARPVAWNGTNDEGLLVEDGVYTYKINAVSTATGAAAVEASGTIATDKTAPIMTNVRMVRDPFNPLLSRQSILYDLNEEANVTVYIYDASNVLVRALTTNATNKVGTNRVVWDGKNSAGEIVPSGAYSYRILAVDKVGWGRYAYSVSRLDTSITYSAPAVTNLSHRPDALKVTGTTAATLYYTLNKPAYVTFRIYDSNNRHVRTLINNVYQTAGAKPVAWYGNDESGALVEDGTYSYRVEAIDSAGVLSLESVGYIVTDKNGPVLTDVTATPAPSNSLDAGTVSIYYVLNEDSNVTVNIYNDANVLVKNIAQAVPNKAGANSLTWDGKDSAGNVVPNGRYNYRMLVTDKVGLGRSYSGVVTLGSPIIFTP